MARWPAAPTPPDGTAHIGDFSYCDFRYIEIFNIGDIVEIALRLLATVLFWSAGIAGVLNFGQVADKVKALGLPFERCLAFGVIAVQLLGSAAVVFNPSGLAWVGAVALAGFTLLTIPFGHAFWTMEEPRKSEELYIAIEHLTVVGCLLAIGFYGGS